MFLRRTNHDRQYSFRKNKSDFGEENSECPLLTPQRSKNRFSGEDSTIVNVLFVEENATSTDDEEGLVADANNASIIKVISHQMVQTQKICPWIPKREGLENV